MLHSNSGAFIEQGNQEVFSPFLVDSSSSRSPTAHWRCFRTGSRLPGTRSGTRWGNPQCRLGYSQC